MSSRDFLAARAINSVDRLPPHSIEAEQGVIGCILLSPDICLEACIEIFANGPSAFYDLKHQTIYSTILAMYRSRPRVAIDVITLHQWLKDKQQLQECGGLDYIAPLPDKIASTSNLEFYARIVLDKYLIRNVISTCTHIISNAYEHQEDVRGFLGEAESSILAIQDTGAKEDTHIRTLLHQALAEIERAVSYPQQLLGLSTGLEDLDAKTSGLEGGDLIVIGAPPSLGKTSLVTQILEHVSRKEPVAIFSFEMRGLALIYRLLAAKAGVNMRQARRGEIDQEQFDALAAAASSLGSTNIHIEYKCPRNLTAIRARGRRMWREHGIKAWGIDYLQLLSGETGRRYDGRHDELSAISKGFKDFAMDTNTPVLLISTVKDDGKLKGSGDIGYDADGFWLLESEKDNVNLVIKKQRNGPRGIVRLRFNEKYTRFETIPKISPDDIPPPVNHGGQGGYTSDAAPAQQEF